VLRLPRARRELLGAVAAALKLRVQELQQGGGGGGSRGGSGGGGALGEQRPQPQQLLGLAGMRALRPVMEGLLTTDGE
jgi:hypothetical protein